MGLQDVEALATRAIGVVDDDAKGDRKPSHDAFARTDEEASFDLAAKFLRMDRATRRAIALQYQPDESFMDASPDELSSIKIDEGRRTCSTQLEVHPTLPFRGKELDSSLKSRKYCRSIPSIDSLESRPESTKETARERISGDSGYGSDYRRRRIQSEYLRGADGSIQRREAAAGAGSTGTTANPQSQQGRQHRIPTRVEYDESDIEESFPESRHSTASFRRNALSANPVGGKSTDAYGQATQRRPKPYEQSRQAKGLRRIRGSTALRPEKPTISSPTQRPNNQIPGRPSLETLDDASSSETGDQPKLETDTTGIQNTLLSMSRMKPRPRSEVTPLSIPWSVASSRPRSEMFLCIAEFSESTGDSDGHSSIESSVFSIPESPIEEHHIHPDDPFQHHLDDAITAVTRHYRAWQVQQRGSSAGEKGTKRANVSTPDSSHHARKRPHTGKQDRIHLYEDDDAGPGYKRAKFPISSFASGRQLACPFWKKDPENHRQCHKKVLSKIKYVKQHLYQSHEAPITSACCGAVFETEDAHDQHVRARQCQIIPGGVQRQGLTRAQIQEIHRRADPRKTEEEKWFAIWSICFPGHPRPTSAYIDNDLSEDLRSFREYFTSQGANIISDFLHDSPSDRRIENEHVVLSSALERIYDDWAAARGLRTIPSLPTPPRTEPSNPTDSDGGSHVSPPARATVHEVLHRGSLSDERPQGYGQTVYMVDPVLSAPTSSLQLQDLGFDGPGFLQQDPLYNDLAGLEGVDNMYTDARDWDQRLHENGAPYMR
ncbi:Het domain protein [Colletotrichum asianum]